VDEDLFWTPARQLRAKFLARELSPLDSPAQRSNERLDPAVHAFITVDADAVLDQARRAEVAATDSER